MERRVGRPSQLVLPHQQILHSVAVPEPARPADWFPLLSTSTSFSPATAASVWPKPACNLPTPGPDAVYRELLLKPLFSFAGKGIRFDPTQADLEAIPPAERSGYLLQQRMHFVPTIETPFGPTQAEIRILYLWPDRGTLTPALSLVRLGRGKMMGVDHNRNQEWVGASAAFFPVIGHINAAYQHAVRDAVPETEKHRRQAAQNPALIAAHGYHSAKLLCSRHSQ